MGRAYLRGGVGQLPIGPPADAGVERFHRVVASNSRRTLNAVPRWHPSASRIRAAAIVVIRAHPPQTARRCVRPRPSSVVVPDRGFPVLHPTFDPCQWLASESLAVALPARGRSAAGRSRSPAQWLSAADLVRREVRAGF